MTVRTGCRKVSAVAALAGAFALLPVTITVDAAGRVALTVAQAQADNGDRGNGRGRDDDRGGERGNSDDRGRDDDDDDDDSGDDDNDDDDGDDDGGRDDAGGGGGRADDGRGASGDASGQAGGPAGGQGGDRSMGRAEPAASAARDSSGGTAGRGGSAGGGRAAVGVTKVEVASDGIEIEYADGTKETIDDGRYERRNAANRTVEERPATGADLARLKAVTTGLRVPSGPARDAAEGGEVRRVETGGNRIEVTYRNGWREEVDAGTYRIRDRFNRTVVRRPATREDLSRLRSLAGE